VANVWDDLMKMLVGANPQHFVSLLLANALFESSLDKELKTRTVQADLLYNVLWNNQKVVLHVEFQRRRDANMGRRLWEYNVLTTCLVQRPVCSFALYIRKGGTIVEPPYEEVLPDGEVVHRFYYRNIKLWEVPGEIFKNPGLEGMLPLLPLTKDGKRYERVEEMITGLRAAGKEDLLPLAYSFSALVFEKDADKEWLKRRFAMLQDVLEESWAYQEMVEKGMLEGLEKGLEKGLAEGLAEGLEKGLAEGLEKGLAEGLEQGELETLQRTAIRLVQKRFPQLLSLAEQHVKPIKNSEALEAMIDVLVDAQTDEEVKQALTKDE